jgi:CHAD domain-containing protein
MAKARKEPSGENHHEWRKRTKYHWYHTRLLKHSFPQHLKPRAETVHDLSNLLGDHHDIHVFLETIEADPAAFCDGETLALLQAMARKRSEQLERRSADLGVRLFADDPKTLVSRWSAWWDAWTTEEARPHAA